MLAKVDKAKGKKGEQQELGRLQPGEYFGEGGILTSQPRNATVRTNAMVLSHYSKAAQADD